MAKPDKTRTYNAQQNMCACSADKIMTGNLTEQEMTLLATGEGKGRLGDEKIVVDIFAPCLASPIREIVYENCTNNRYWSKTVKSQQGLEGMCHCTANGMEKYAAAYGSDILALVYYKQAHKDRRTGASVSAFTNMEGDDIVIKDPLTTLIENLDYQKEFYTVRRNCMGAFHYR